MSLSVPHRTRGSIVHDRVISGQAGLRVKAHRIAAAGILSTSVQDTGFNLPIKGIVTDVLMDVRTAEATGATKTIEVGLLASETGGDEDGFLDALDVSATGVFQGVLLAAGQTRGALMREVEEGTVNVPKNHVMNGTARSLTFTLASNDWVEFVGILYVAYFDLDGLV